MLNQPKFLKICYLSFAITFLDTPSHIYHFWIKFLDVFQKQQKEIHDYFFGGVFSDLMASIA